MHTLNPSASILTKKVFHLCRGESHFAWRLEITGCRSLGSHSCMEMYLSVPSPVRVKIVKDLDKVSRAEAQHIFLLGVKVKNSKNVYGLFRYRIDVLEEYLLLHGDRVWSDNGPAHSKR